MDFLISGTHINPVYLIVIGFIIGICGGFFGVGGSFLAGPALFAFGVPMNFVVGTDLAHIVGKSIVAAKKHRALGNVDIKLGLIMASATIIGVETGAQIIQQLKRHKNLDVVVAIAFIIVLVGISSFIAWECWQTLKMGKKTLTAKSQAKGKPKQDHSAIAYIAKNFHRFHLPPMISLPNSGIKQISLWTILAVAYIGGVFSGFLGGGAVTFACRRWCTYSACPLTWPSEPICSK